MSASGGLQVVPVVKFSAKQQERINAAIERAKEGSLSSAAYVIRMDAVKSSRYRKDREKAAEEGSPPYRHQHSKGFFRAGIRYAVDRHRADAIIGWIHSVAGKMMATHEEGKRERVVTKKGKQRFWADFPERPVMRPALARNIDRFARDWRGAVK